MKRPEWFLNEWYWLHVCTQIKQCADDLLAGRIGVVAASRLLHPLLHEVRGMRDPDFQLFEGIYSESDTFPVGSGRAHWSEAALKREDEKLARYEAQRHEAACVAATNLRERYAG